MQHTWVLLKHAMQDEMFIVAVVLGSWHKGPVSAVVALCHLSPCSLAAS